MNPFDALRPREHEELWEEREPIHRKQRWALPESAPVIELARQRRQLTLDRLRKPELP